jgi:hypothetical protein
MTAKYWEYPKLDFCFVRVVGVVRGLKSFFGPNFLNPRMTCGLQAEDEPPAFWR